jgi:ribokinase
MIVQAPRLPGPGETVLGGAFATASGGKGANQAVAAARLGAAVSFVGSVGDDALGQGMIESLQAEGIDTRFVTRDPSAPSGVALIVVDPSGENLIAVAPGANMRLSAAVVERAAPAFDAADVILVQLEVPLEAVSSAIQMAQRRGKRIILNPAPARPLPGEILSQVDILTPNETEAEALGRPPAEDERQVAPCVAGALADPNPAADATRLLTLGAGCVIVTLGPQGVLVAQAGRQFRVPAPQVEAVDATAAGDAFSGALAAALAGGLALEPAVEFAVSAATLSVTRLGAQPSLPGLSELRNFVHEVT